MPRWRRGLKATKQKITVGGRQHTVYKGPRGGKYWKYHGPGSTTHAISVKSTLGSRRRKRQRRRR